MNLAVIFDMDGVISDTQCVHSAVEAGLLQARGVDISPESIDLRYAGVPSREMFAELLAEKATSALVERLCAEKKQKMLDAEVCEIPGACALIKRLHPEFKLAVASSSSRSFISCVLSKLDLERYFSAIVSVEDVSAGKPNPEIFLAAANRLEVAPAACLVIEDSIHGMTAAKRAGMAVLGLVRRPVPGANYPADSIVDSLAGLNPGQLRAMINAPRGI